MDAIFIWMFVVNLGVVFGAGVYEARISVPRWLGPPNAGRPWLASRPGQSRRRWAQILGLHHHDSAHLADPRQPLGGRSFFGAHQFWWLTAATLAFADRVFTFAYFIPRRWVTLLQI